MCVLLAGVLASLTLAQTPNPIPGVWVLAPDGPVELIAFAEPRRNRTLEMSAGTLDDVPTVRPHAMLRVLTSRPNWRPTNVFIASASVFTDRSAENRPLRFTRRQVNVYSQELRIADLEAEAAVVRLAKMVRASAQSPAYAFIVLNLSGVLRYYPVRLDVTLP